MKRLVILLFIANSSLLFAQHEWAPKGATWYYDFSDQFWKEGYIEIKNIGDTIIDQKSCKLLQAKIISYDYIFQNVDTGIGSTEITYYDSSIVYIYRFNKFFKIFDFNASVGDSWEIPSFLFNSGGLCDTIATAIVDDVGTTIINSDTLRTLKLNIKTGSQFGYQGTVIERIGSLSFMYPYYIACVADAGGGNGLRCYRDDNFYYQRGTKECDWLPTGINDASYSAVIKLFPNPVEKQFKLIIPDNVINDCLKVVIFNSAGLELMHSQLTDGIVDVSILPSGIYLAKVICKDSIYINKFIKK